MKNSFLQQDAQNRSLRTLLQNLVFDVLAAVGLVLYTAFNNADNWGALDWKLLGFLLVKSVVVSVFSYVMRLVVDPSKIPTPLPPQNPGQPADPNGPVVVGGDGGYYAPAWLLVLLAILIILAILYLLGLHVNVG